MTDATEDRIDLRIDERQFPHVVEDGRLVLTGGGWRRATHVSREGRIARPQQPAKTSPQLYARVCGVLYGYILVAGPAPRR